MNRLKTGASWLGIFVVAIVLAAVAMPVHTAQGLTTAANYLPHAMIAGATLGANVTTLADVAKRVDPDGSIAEIVELLAQTNEIIADAHWKEGNLPTGDQVTMRTGLPTVYWRIANQGVTPSKSTTAQVVEQAGQMEAWSELDKKIADLNGNTAEYRMSEGTAFLEALNQEFAGTLIYGNHGLAPEEFTGLAVRYSSLSAANSQNIINAIGSGSGGDNTSIWLIVWGPNTAYCLYPKGSKAGIQHNDFGEQTVETSSGVGGTRLRVYQEQWTWECGFALKDWRYVVRIANIDISLLVANDANSAKLFQLMTKAVYRIPNLRAGRAVFYVNRTIAEYLDIQAQDKVSSGGQLSYEVIDGQPVQSFRKIPIRIIDQILETEAAVT